MDDFLKYVVVNVFTPERYKGNPLSVIFSNEILQDTQYQSIAREFGYSETSFVGYKDGRLQVRSFTPAGVEVGGAGHNLLGAVYAALLKDRTIFHGNNNPHVWIKGESMLLSIDENLNIGARQKPAELRANVPIDLIAAALSLSPKDIGTGNLLPTVVETEVTHLMVPLRNLESLNRAAVSDKNQVIKLGQQYDFEGVYSFALSENESLHIAEARFFNPSIGIDEDAATGSAAGPLAGFLQHHSIIESDKKYCILQGVALDQPSVLGIEVKTDGIWVSGQSVLIMDGTIYL